MDVLMKMKHGLLDQVLMKHEVRFPYNYIILINKLF
jgi:hypothetical protein